MDRLLVEAPARRLSTVAQRPTEASALLGSLRTRTTCVCFTFFSARMGAMRLSALNGVSRALWLVTLVMSLAAPSAMAQATSAFNGRVLDQAAAVLPGVTITTTNTSTGVVRTTVTNAEGAYYLPGL